MGVKLKSIMPTRPIELKDLAGKSISIDAFNWIYQFLTTIRLADGSLLTDRKGNVTTHLNGLFYRSINLLENNITPFFVFDGPAPKFKKETLKERQEAKQEAVRLAATAKTPEEKNMYLRRSAAINDYIIDSSKDLLDLMGIPYLQAPAEGEAQAAKINRDGLVYAVASQDYDTLLFGANRLVRNLNISNRKKVAGKGISANVSPELIETKDVGLSREQMILISLFVGTDYNEGVKGIGPKKALDIAKSKSAEEILGAYDFGSSYDIKEVYQYFLEPKVVESREKPELKSIDKERLMAFLCTEHSFDEQRMKAALERINRQDNVLSRYG